MGDTATFVLAVNLGSLVIFSVGIWVIWYLGRPHS